MRHKFEYKTQEDRTTLIDEHKDKVLVEEQNITEGNFLVFDDGSTFSDAIHDLKQESIILKAQTNALSERADFIEDVVAEMATQVYQ